jgi:hypothetical protein
MENEILSKVSNVRRRVIETDVDWGLYVDKKASGKYFTDGEGNVVQYIRNTVKKDKYGRPEGSSTTTTSKKKNNGGIVKALKSI